MFTGLRSRILVAILSLFLFFYFWQQNIKHCYLVKFLFVILPFLLRLTLLLGYGDLPFRWWL